MTWLRRLLETMSPELVNGFKDGLQQLLQGLYAKALETENEWDDWGVKMMAKVFGIDLVTGEKAA